MQNKKLKNKTFLISLLLLFILTPSFKSPHAMAYQKDFKEDKAEAFTEILLKFKPGHLEGEAEKEEFFRRFGVVVSGTIKSLKVYKVKPVDAEADINKLLEEIKSDPDILYAEPNSKVSAQ